MTGVFLFMQTPAKINLYLKVLGKRQDGYHEIETIFWPIASVCDDVEIELRESGGLSMSCDGASEGVPCDERNLCVKAAEAFRNVVGDFSAHINLTKRIPVAAGMGGGSSDAAAVLLELRRLIAPKMNDDELQEIAVKLGADVPFFLNPVPCVARGIGEKRERIVVQGAPSLVLVHPRFPVPASWAYAHCEKNVENNASIETMLSAMAAGDWKTVEANVRNDLEIGIFRKYPILCMIRERLEELGVRNVHISGSGPVMFGFKGANNDVLDVIEKEFEIVEGIR